MRTGKHTVAEKEKHVSGRAIFFFLEWLQQSKRYILFFYQEHERQHKGSLKLCDVPVFFFLKMTFPITVFIFIKVQCFTHSYVFSGKIDK